MNTLCTSVKKQMLAILAAMNTTEQVVEIRPEKNFRLVRDLNA